jgi:O-antigen ligase
MPATRGLEHLVMTAAVFLALVPSWRLPAIFFTVSDLLVCVALVLLALRRGLPAAPFGVLSPLWYLCFAIFMLGLLGSSLLHGQPERGLIIGLQYVFAYIALPFVLMRPEQPILTGLIKTFVIAVIFENLASIGLYYIGYQGELPLIPAHFASGSGRLGAFLEDPNMNANIIALTCPFVLYLWFAGEIKVYYAVPALAALMISLVMASSVGGLMASGLGIATFLVASRSLRVLLQSVTGLAVGLVIVLTWSSQELPTVFQDRVLGAVHSGDIDQAGTFADRVKLIKEAWAMIDQTLLYGVGADQFRTISDERMPVHNMYLLVWVEGGLPALFGWLCLLLIPVLSAFYVYRATPHRLIGGVAMAVSLVFVFVANSAAHMYARLWAIPLELALALVVGALATRTSPVMSGLPGAWPGSTTDGPRAPYAAQLQTGGDLD